MSRLSKLEKLLIIVALVLAIVWLYQNTIG